MRQHRMKDVYLASRAQVGERHVNSPIDQSMTPPLVADEVTRYLVNVHRALLQSMPSSIVTYEEWKQT